MDNNHKMPPYFRGYHQPVPNILPQQAIQVSGRASVDTILLAPNSSILVMDTSTPPVWLCGAVGVGKATVYDCDPITARPDSLCNNPAPRGRKYMRGCRKEETLSGDCESRGRVSGRNPAAVCHSKQER